MPLRAGLRHDAVISPLPPAAIADTIRQIEPAIIADMLQMRPPLLRHISRQIFFIFDGRCQTSAADTRRR